MLGGSRRRYDATQGGDPEPWYPPVMMALEFDDLLKVNMRIEEKNNGEEWRRARKVQAQRSREQTQNAEGKMQGRERG